MEEIQITKTFLLFNRRRRIGISIELNVYIKDMDEAISTLTQDMQIDVTVGKSDNNCTRIIIYYATKTPLEGTLNCVPIKEVSQLIEFANTILNMAVTLSDLKRKCEALTRDINGIYYSKFEQETENENKTEGIQ